MPFEWKETCLFQRNSNLYKFSKDRLFRKNEFQHIFMPWDDSIENNLMYLLKADIQLNGEALIPLMNYKQNNFEIQSSELSSLQEQMGSSKGETHLIMSNLKSIHIFRIREIIGKKDLKDQKINENFKKEKFMNWIVVDDLFVLDVNHIGDEIGLSQRLVSFIEQQTSQNFFKAPHSCKNKNLESQGKFKWINSDRSLTYDYFIRSCELKDNIFQMSWDDLGRTTQHSLVTCELKRQQCVFYRDMEKWNHLKGSFDAYKEALICELNEIYVLPLIHSINSFNSLEEAWNIAKDGLMDPRIVKIIDSILTGNKSQIDCMEDFLFFTKNSKSLFYSLKNHFSKKFHKEEYLLIENFLGRHESLVFGFHCKDLNHIVELILKIDEWKLGVDQNVSTLDQNILKDYNLKLSHLVSIMISANYEDNIFFKLLEEKMAKGTIQKSFTEEVKELIEYKFKRSA